LDMGKGSIRRKFVVMIQDKSRTVRPPRPFFGGAPGGGASRAPHAAGEAEHIIPAEI